MSLKEDICPRRQRGALTTPRTEVRKLDSKLAQPPLAAESVCIESLYAKMAVWSSGPSLVHLVINVSTIEFFCAQRAVDMLSTEQSRVPRCWAVGEYNGHVNRQSAFSGLDQHILLHVASCKAYMDSHW